ncbi:MAG TPA: DUF3098 domain-containing protein [Bacteroidales bacterium]|nr:DUF3098 domain-containing protein [Bacteroidales bacterium]
MAKKNKDQSNFALGPQNYKLLIIGFFIIAVGFLLMLGGKTEDPTVFNEEEIFSFRRITLAPIVVLFGFAFEVYAIMRKTDNQEQED